MCLLAYVSIFSSNSKLPNFYKRLGNNVKKIRESELIECEAIFFKVRHNTVRVLQIINLIIRPRPALNVLPWNYALFYVYYKRSIITKQSDKLRLNV